MKQQSYNTFHFIRSYFNLPSTMKLCWAIIEETTSCGTEYRLGVRINERQYIDVAMRRMFSVIQSPLITRLCHKATRCSEGANFRYETKQGWAKVLPKNYIYDIYHSSWYDSDHQDDLL